MEFQKYTFNKELDAEFAQTLKSRVKTYLKNSKTSRFGDWKMLLKSGVVLATFIIPWLSMLIFQFSSIPLLFGLWLMMGIGMTGIGVGIAHDALHGSYSPNKNLNNLMGLSMNIIGANAFVWKMQHNVLHHSFTNIAHADDDIATPPFLRFSPHQKRYWIHQFQHIYVWFFYGISTMFWVTSKDFVQLGTYYKRGLISLQKYRQQIAWVVLWKIVYFTLILVLPTLLLPVSFGWILLMFLSMHFMAGIMLSSIFQPAHVITDAEFVEQDEKEVEQNWHVHQMLTTSNFAPKNHLLTWCFGGLNYQIEHHLFPNVCHLHYPNLSKIVQSTAEEFGIPYNSQKSYRLALVKHVQMLRFLGKAQPEAVLNAS